MFVKNWGVCAFFAKILQNYVVQQIFTIGNSSCGKVMFSQVCVKNSVHSGGGEGVSQHALVVGWGLCIPACTGQVGCVADTPLGRHPPRADTSPPPVATAPDGMHPTGMHSC